MRQGGEAVAVGAGLRRRVHGGFGHGGERARGREREGEIDPNGSAGVAWRYGRLKAPRGSRRWLGACASGTRLCPSGMVETTTGVGQLGWAGTVPGKVSCPGRCSLSLF